MATSDDHYNQFVTNLQKKLQIAFNEQPANAFAFFDISGNEALRIDEFLFGVEFFIQGNRLRDCLMLFQELDTSKDGMLDEAEFETLFTFNPVKPSPLQDSLLKKDSVGEEAMGNYM